MRVDVIGPAVLPEPRRIALGQVLRESEQNQWVEVEGKATWVRPQSEVLQMELSAGAGRMRVEVADGSGWSAALLLNRRVRATGFCQSAHTTDGQSVAGILLVPGAKEIAVIGQPELAGSTGTNGRTLPVLATAGEVHGLKSEEAQRGYSVKVRGVVTCVLPEHQAVTIQDATRGLYVVDGATNRTGPPKSGSCWKSKA
ncbi:MAG: hypothetical protein HY674_07810 [Chloroflexi bacterium]|nr:hypothetical protein [Chloroflexota bacterium]